MFIKCLLNSFPQVTSIIGFTDLKYSCIFGENVVVGNSVKGEMSRGEFSQGKSRGGKCRGGKRRDPEKSKYSFQNNFTGKNDTAFN